MKKTCLLWFLLLPFLHHAQDRYSVLITELMADPTPVVGMPNNEWIELKNVSGQPINLQGWRLGDASNLSGALPNYLLQADSFVVICAAGSLPAMLALGPAISVNSFPSLDNDGELVYLHSPNGSSIHAVEYEASWYGNEIKKSGGWTLEMKDPLHPCAGSVNWAACMNPSGGTPGRANSTDSPHTDTDGPVIRKAYTTDSVTIIVVFDEALDSASGSIVSHYVLHNGPGIALAEPIPPLFRDVRLVTAAPLTTHTTYSLSVNGISDCSGNQVIPGATVSTGIPSPAGPGDCVINEILFNPRPNGYDYVEIFNNSDKIIDLATLIIGNRAANGSVGSPVPVSSSPHYLFPSAYVVVTENVDNLLLQYLVRQPARVVELSSLPSLPDTEGTVILLNVQGEILDEVHYSDDWHFKLISEPEGISLERIDADVLSANPTNWHSAASTAGYGTPGYQNSQQREPIVADDIIRVEPRVFSPDNDGRDDVAGIFYSVGVPGYLGTITIFDSRGMTVRHLVRNAILGESGYWNWDGLDDTGKKLSVGVYVVLAEMFNLAGKVIRYKHAVALVRPLK